MRLPRTVALAVLAFATLLVLSPPARAASIWTPVDSGLGISATDVISAIDYQGENRFWYATQSGKVRRRVNGAFVAPASVPTGNVTFNDIAFEPGGTTGVAVGSHGTIWRSYDSGATWTRANFTAYAQPCGAWSDTAAGLPATTNPDLNLFTATWASGGVIYVGGEKGVLLRSTNGGDSFQEINKSREIDRYGDYVIECVLDEDFYDVVPLAIEDTQPENERPIYMLGRGGQVYYSSNGWSGTPDDKVWFDYGSSTRKQLVVDPVNTNRMWAITSGGDGALYLTKDGSNEDYPDVYGDDEDELEELYGIAGAGPAPTIVVVGEGGDVLNSIDGEDFYYNRAAGALETQDWYAVSGYDASHFAIGGKNGKLAITDKADTIPDVTPPRGTVSGPEDLTPGQTATFTVSASDEAGGSGIDPNSYAWTATGTSGGSGTSVTLTFPNTGAYVITFTFRDLAGNAGSARKYVDVDNPVTPPVVVTPPPPAPPAPPAPPRAIAPSVLMPAAFAGPSTKPPIIGKGAVRKGGKVTVKAKGKLALPAGAVAAKAFAGKVGLTVLKGKTLLVYRETPVKPDGSFAKTITVPAKKVGSAKKLTLRVKFFGNTVMAAVERTYTVKVVR